MFGIRNFLRRHFSIEAMTTAVERKIASDMTRDPLHPRNAVGGTLIAALQSVRDQAVARRELEALMSGYNERAIDVAERVKTFNSQTPEWRAAHPEIRAQIEQDAARVTEDAERIKTLAATARVDLGSVTVSS
jgi:hypothetical protein